MHKQKYACFIPNGNIVNNVRKGPYTMVSYEDDTHNLIDLLKIKDACGYSIGTGIEISRNLTSFKEILINQVTQESVIARLKEIYCKSS